MQKKLILAASAVIVVAGAVGVTLELTTPAASAAPLVVSSRVDAVTVLSPHALRVEATLTNISHGTGKTTKCVFFFDRGPGAHFFKETAPRPGRSEAIEADLNLPAGADPSALARDVGMTC